MILYDNGTPTFFSNKVRFNKDINIQLMLTMITNINIKMKCQ